MTASARPDTNPSLRKCAKIILIQPLQKFQPNRSVAKLAKMIVGFKKFPEIRTIYWKIGVYTIIN